MKTSDLHSIWNAPDHSRLTTKQYTVRLPIRVAAQLAALSEMYPRKTMTDLISDLLAAGLDQLGEELPTKNIGEKPLGQGEDGEDEWEQIGPGVTFARLTQKYLKELDGDKPSNQTEEVPSRSVPKHKNRTVNRKPMK